MLSIIFIALAAACWAIMSHYTFHNRTKNEFSFWGANSWKRKYKRSDSCFSGYCLIKSRSNWYYRLFKIRYKEKFPGSATVFVFLTDGYHLTQWFMIKFIIGAITLNWIYFLILWATWTIVFNIVYIEKKNI